MVNRPESDEVLDRYGFFVSPGESHIEETVDAAVARRRELKWLDMLTQWPSFIASRFDKIKERCRKGIPGSVRGQAWYHLSAAKYRQENEDRNCPMESLFYYYLTKTPDARVLDDIKKDLARSFPDHEMFRDDGCGQNSLNDVLRAYAIHDPDVGYCQAQAPIAAILLMHLPPEQAFWVFVQINEEYVKGYFSDGLRAIKEDALATEILIKRVSPKGYHLLHKLDVDPILYTVDWYMTLFSRTYRAPQLYRLWDMFFCEGVKVLFRLALVIVYETLEDGPSSIVSRAHKCDNAMDIVTLIKQTAKQLPFSVLLSKMDKLPLTDIDLAQACKQARQKLNADGKAMQNRKK
ncbi:unnamed protein product [Rotaria socialis]|uniref:Rab-GAP TBC domain-containing protein n=1 Tax=Rotaria socialis TaxID=392032 RepID=A0A817Y9H6_9BILA|nr:unnamed protein product [Rotaria socialis]CAF3305922.1 unnamed protein product [Rotaria socialis]CAF3377532.1 unnamed protein product [Rotaria socialis]CAF3396799.1 unnamed protein product [Rotaria socialis]CAF3766637.1 unnamed protein product [Rotaria socialis]